MPAPCLNCPQRHATPRDRYEEEEVPEMVKYMLTWWERPGDSYSEHEAAQKRILEIFEKWEIPESLTFHQFLVRVGEFGGYAVVETDDLAEIEKAIATYAAFQFRLEPVMDVADAAAAQAEGIAWREENAPA